MTVFETTHWKFDTSEEYSASLLFFSCGSGSLYQINVSTGEKLKINLGFGSVGASKGGAINLAESLPTDPIHI